MSAVLRWRCDICHNVAEIVEEVPRGLMAFYHPKLPRGWVRKTDGKRDLDLCSQRCIVAYQQRILDHEQRKLAADGT